MYYDASKEIKRIIKMLKLEGIADGDVVDSIDHGEIVSRLGDMLSENMHLDDRTKEVIHNAAVLHDVGKLQISQNIYGRTKGGFRVAEMRYMRKHPRIGADMLSRCEYPDDVVNAVLHHHECYDGNGYPDGLNGELIPYAARIIHVCDSFVTLVSDRPYRPAFDTKTAINMMISKNMDFDMKAFVGFIELTHEKNFEEILRLVEQINKKHKYFERQDI